MGRMTDGRSIVLNQKMMEQVWIAFAASKMCNELHIDSPVLPIEDPTREMAAWLCGKPNNYYEFASSVIVEAAKLVESASWRAWSPTRFTQVSPPYLVDAAKEFSDRVDGLIQKMTMGSAISVSEEMRRLADEAIHATTSEDIEEWAASLSASVYRKR